MVEGSKDKNIISYWQLFLITIAQSGGATVIYLPGVAEAGRDIWISNIVASVMAYVVIFTHYLPLSQCPGCSMTKTLNQYWGKVVGGIVNLYYFFFFFLLCCLIVSDVFYLGKITMPETPGYVFIIFLLVPAIYGVKLGMETFVRLLEFMLPVLIVVYLILIVLAIPKLELGNLVPVMSEGIRPVLGGAIPNMNFPYAQILPIAFFYKYTKASTEGNRKFLEVTFGAILLATMLLTFRAIISAAAFEEATLKTLTFPPFSTIRIIEIAGVLERLDALLLALFYGTTFAKFILTYYILCQIISDYSNVGEPKDYALPIAVLIGVSMPFLIPRFDLTLKTAIPYFIVSLPLFIPIPLLLFMTIKLKNKGQKGVEEQ